MKMRITKKWNPLADTYQLTKQEIESQVLSDLAKYRKRYQEKYNKSIPSPIDVDNFVKELWDFDINFKIIQQEPETDEILGYLLPESRKIIVDENCTNQRRVSFTIAHEAGHISLHGPLFSTDEGLITGWKNSDPCKNKKKLDTANIRREWQANVYAGTLLAPKIEVESFLQEIGLVDGITLIEFNLDNHFSKFEERFGLSRQALKIRLEHLKIPFKDSRYNVV